MSFLSNAQIDVQFSNLCFFSNSQIYKCVLLFFNFSNRRPMTSLAYAITLTNKSATDLRILEGHQKVTDKPLNRTVIWGNDFSRCQSSFEPPMQSHHTCHKSNVSQVVLKKCYIFEPNEIQDGHTGLWFGNTFSTSPELLHDKSFDLPEKF